MSSQVGVSQASGLPGQLRGPTRRALGAQLLVGARPLVITVAVLVIRAALENHTLQAELPGYQEYARQVRNRLLPGVW